MTFQLGVALAFAGAALAFAGTAVGAFIALLSAVKARGTAREERIAANAERDKMAVALEAANEELRQSEAARGREVELLSGKLERMRGRILKLPPDSLEAEQLIMMALAEEHGFILEGGDT